MRIREFGVLHNHNLEENTLKIKHRYPSSVKHLIAHRKWSNALR